MVALSPAVLDGVRLVVRQVTDTIVPTTATPSSTVAATTTAATPADTSVNSTPGSPGGNNTGNNNSNGNSPLLFFVALGFGVVFTNLWIIVGVKYCFRYNARNRAMRVNEDGEPITLENMPRPHRRRREKKLMTMDEVNEKFPMQKYKSWVASRAQEGLPTRGGVSVPPSRANSIRSARGVATELASKERTSSEGRPTSSASVAVKTRDTSKADVTTKPEATESTSSAAVADPNADGSATSTPAPGQPIQAEPTIAQQKAARTSDDHSSEDDDEHINAALPPEFMTSGDTCAICIDSLDDDEDVRGLTCGHAFHAVCVDPWLTSRRACCPLCKADYYTPKPRPAAADGSPGTDGGATGIVTVTLPENGGRRSDRQPRTQSNWLSFRSRGRSATNGNSSSTPAQRRQPATANVDPNANSTQGGGGLLARLRPSASNGASRQTPTESNAPAPAPAPAQGQSSGGFLSNLRSPFRQHAPVTNAPTPSQVEAGTAAR